GTRQRGQQRGLFLSRDHARRSAEQSSGLRTISEREPERLARYRSRFTEWRSAGARYPGNLPALRATRCSHDRECHYLSGAKRSARDRKSAEFFTEHPRSLFALVRERRFSP